ncbi:hypothetical protein PTTG_27252 [Puccinia triticina 1-1 BBBD Race 1]|uniref:Uncharacterized protein n=1 Tax=Puccinia triticina (isolate 1-1 / race 1 (BBBD)) TaxID=630390 RepID=A0A180GLL7_PUCT1|nr:hypothetical protein PTTG_27252 [Puccinia triticina 1-1 BBBD Race 1]
MATFSATPQSPSQPPSLQSTRITTTVRSHLNYIRPSRDSQKSVQRLDTQISHTQNTENSIDPNSETKSLFQSQRSRPSNHKCMYHPCQNQKNSQRKKKKTGIKLNVEDNYEEVDAIINHTQDSDAENSKVQKPTKKKTSPFDTIRDYFKAPFHAKPTDTGEELMFTCKWCSSVYKKGLGTNSNLYKHCDRNSARAHCPGQSEAIKAGCKLPLSKQEIKEKDDHRNQGNVRGSL